MSEGGRFDLRNLLSAVAVFVLAYAGFTLLLRRDPARGPGGGTLIDPNQGRPGPTAPTVGRRALGIEAAQEPEGLAVRRVLPGSSAEAAGLSEEDLLLEVEGRSLAPDGTEPDKRPLLIRTVNALPEGQPLRLLVRRGGETRTVEVALRAAGSFELELARELERDAVRRLGELRRPDDGLWPDYMDPARPSVAVSALVAYALSRSEGAEGEFLWEGALDALLEQRDPRDGGLADPAAAKQHRTYANSLLLLALLPHPERAAERQAALDWLRGAQADESHRVGFFDSRYGGWSYHDTFGADLRTDVSTARYALQALSAAALPDDDPVWGRARLFLEQCQNQTLITGEDDPLHAAESGRRDGGFAFAPRMSKAGRHPVGNALVVYRSYGSATADGVLSLLALGGVDRRASKEATLPADERLQAALGWLARNYELEGNPGFPAQSGWRDGIYLYYLAALAEALHQAGVWEVVGPDGVRHLWAAELVRALRNLGNRSEGYRGSSLMHEDSPTLAAAFVTVAAAAARDRLELGGGAVLEADVRPALLPRDLEAPAPAPADAVARGAETFQRRGCVGCHGDAPGGNSNGPWLGDVGARYLEAAKGGEAARSRLKAFLLDPAPERALSPGQWPARMQPVQSALGVTEAELEDLLTFLLQVR